MNAFSQTVMDHFLYPRRTDALPHPSGEGWAGALTSSRYMRIQVSLCDGVIVDASFGTYGCAPAIAAGSYLCEWAVGRTLDEAGSINAETLNTWLGGLPPARRFCADLAVDALKAAVSHAKQAPIPDSIQ